MVVRTELWWEGQVGLLFCLHCGPQPSGGGLLSGVGPYAWSVQIVGAHLVTSRVLGGTVVRSGGTVSGGIKRTLFDVAMVTAVGHMQAIAQERLLCS